MIVSAAPQATAMPAQRPAQFDVRAKHAYLIGIGGCGMSGLARMLAARGALVTGSDKESSAATDALIAEGVEVGFDQSREWLPEACDLVIASAAVRPEHPQMLEATRRGVPTHVYAEALGLTMLGRTGVAIAGTHGKSTTVGMLGHTLIQCGIDPTVIVGATVPQLAEGRSQVTENRSQGSSGKTQDPRPKTPPVASAGFRLGADRVPSGPMMGKPGVLVAEACEFNRSFHSLFPNIAAITSVEADHLEVYGSLDAVVQSFRDFARLVPSAKEGGKLFINHDGAHRREVTGGVECAVETVGFAPAADWVVTYDTQSRRVGLSHAGQLVGTWTLRVPGAHMAIDSAFAAVIALHLGAEAAKVEEALSSFTGVDRRMQYLGEKGGVRVYDDYGHHPTEVDTTLRALREAERPEERGGRLICVFQPHQHSRTRFLLEEFAQAFGMADIVIVPHIYFVRDSEIEKTKVSAADLVDRLRGRGVQAMHLYPFEAIVEQLQNVCRAGDLLVVMGAGPVWRVAKGFLAAGG